MKRLAAWLCRYGPWLLLAACWGWRETWIQARCAAQVAEGRWTEQETRLDQARAQIDALLSRAGLPKWWTPGR